MKSNSKENSRRDAEALSAETKPSIAEKFPRLRPSARENWKRVKLGEVCEITMGQSPESSTYNTEKRGLPFFQGNADFGVYVPTPKVWCSAPKKIASPEAILISVRAPIGAMNFSNQTCCIGRGLASIFARSSSCYKRYIWYAVKSRSNLLISQGTGSTFKAINKEVLTSLEIPLPPLEEQRRIAGTLDKVRELIDLRERELAKFDELVKCRFCARFFQIWRIAA